MGSAFFVGDKTAVRIRPVFEVGMFCAAECRLKWGGTGQYCSLFHVTPGEHVM